MSQRQWYGRIWLSDDSNGLVPRKKKLLLGFLVFFFLVLREPSELGKQGIKFLHVYVGEKLRSAHLRNGLHKCGMKEASSVIE